MTQRYPFHNRQSKNSSNHTLPHRNPLADFIIAQHRARKSVARVWKGQTTAFSWFIVSSLWTPSVIHHSWLSRLPTKEDIQTTTFLADDIHATLWGTTRAWKPRKVGIGNAGGEEIRSYVDKPKRISSLPVGWKRTYRRPSGFEHGRRLACRPLWFMQRR